MTDSINIWEIYGSREDTDAAVVRNLYHKLMDAERAQFAAQQLIDKLRIAIKGAGYEFHQGYSYGEVPSLKKLEENK